MDNKIIVWLVFVLFALLRAKPATGDATQPPPAENSNEEIHSWYELFAAQNEMIDQNRTVQSQDVGLSVIIATATGFGIYLFDHMKGDNTLPNSPVPGHHIAGAVLTIIAIAIAAIGLHFLRTQRQGTEDIASQADRATWLQAKIQRTARLTGERRQSEDLRTFLQRASIFALAIAVVAYFQPWVLP